MLVAESMREPAAQHGDEPQPEFTAQRQQFLVLGFDELPAKLRVLVGRKVANGPDAPAGVLTRVDERHARARATEFMRRGQARQPRARDDDVSGVHDHHLSNDSATYNP